MTNHNDFRPVLNNDSRSLDHDFTYPQFGVNTIARPEVIRVFGVGGAGGNTINTLSSLYDVPIDIELIALNTDSAALQSVKATRHILLGEKYLQGKGAGSNTLVGLSATEEARDTINKLLEGVDLLFIAAGMGGGTGTLSSGAIAEMAKEKGILVVAIVTLPFDYEGAKRKKQALEGVEKLRRACNTFITIDNNKLNIIPNTSLKEIYYEADRVLCESVIGITDLVTSTQYVNADFNDISTTLSKGGRALISTAFLEVDDDENFDPSEFADRLIKKALENPLLTNNDIRGAKNLLVSVSLPERLGSTYFDISNRLTNLATKDNVELEHIPAYGTLIPPEGKIQGRLSIIATGIEDEDGPSLTSTQPITTSLHQNPFAKHDQTAASYTNQQHNYYHTQANHQVIDPYNNHMNQAITSNNNYNPSRYDQTAHTNYAPNQPSHQVQHQQHSLQSTPNYSAHQVPVGQQNSLASHQQPIPTTTINHNPPHLPNSSSNIAHLPTLNPNSLQSSVEKVSIGKPHNQHSASEIVDTDDITF